MVMVGYGWFNKKEYLFKLGNKHRFNPFPVENITINNKILPTTGVQQKTNVTFGIFYSLQFKNDGCQYVNRFNDEKIVMLVLTFVL